MSIDSSISRPIGAYPVDYKTNILDNNSGISATPASAKTDSISKRALVGASGSGALQSKKRRNGQIKAITADMTIDEIIEIEVSERGFHKEEKRAQFRKTLQLIAINNREVFDEDEENFKAVFGKQYVSFKKDDCDFYLLRFIIMFGADQLIRRRCRNHVLVTEESHRFSEAFDYLMKTKNFDVLIDLLGESFPFELGDEMFKRTVEVIKANHPNLPFFKNLFVESLKARNLSYFTVVFREKDERIAFNFNLILELSETGLWKIGKSDSDIKFHKAVLRFPEYYLELDDTSKMVFIRLCFEFDDVESFEKIVDLYPEIVSYVKLAGNDFDNDENILHEAILENAIKCIRFICEIAPELILVSTPKMIPALKFAISRKTSDVYDIFYNLGYTESYIINIDADGLELNLIQYAFHARSFETLTYFIKKVGLATVREEIKNIWGTIEQILVHSLNYLSYPYQSKFIGLIVKIFDIDVNANYKYNNLEGNVMIFLEPYYKQAYRQIPDLNIRVPVYMTNPLTGIRCIVNNFLR